MCTEVSSSMIHVNKENKTGAYSFWTSSCSTAVVSFSMYITLCGANCFFTFPGIQLRSGNTGNIFLQLVLQHCCSASWNSLLRVLPPAWPTCLATNLTSTLVISCQRSAATRQIKKCCVAKSRLEFYFLQQILVLMWSIYEIIHIFELRL